MKHPRLVVALLFVIATFIALLMRGDRRPPDDAALRAAQGRITILQAELAESKLSVERVTDTVIRRVTATVTARDTLLVHLTDTVMVREYIAATDSALSACVDLVYTCREYRTKAAGLIDALTTEKDWWKQAYNRQQHPRCGRKCGVLIGVASTILAAKWLGEVQRAGRP